MSAIDETVKSKDSQAERTAEILEHAFTIAREVVDGENILPSRPEGWFADGPHLSSAGHELDEVIEAVRQVITETPSSAGSRFFNQLFGGRDPVATFAEILTTLTNTSMYTFKVAGPQILIEKEVVARMAAKVGYENGDGILAPGGSMANLTALIVARNEAVSGVRDAGFDGTRYTVYTSEAGHYSTRKNAGIVGLGRDSVREVATDGRGRMDVACLKRMIAEDRAVGFIPIMINATAGTTVLGAFDPLSEIAEVAESEKVWMHVDGALGGSVLLSEKHRHLLEGSQLADSFTWNAHKMMGVPLSCSAILMKERGLLGRHFNEDAGYLFQADVDDLNPGTRSIQCGRRNDALKLWAAWLYHGDEGYRARLDHLFDLAHFAADRIKADPALDLVASPESIAVCFEVKGSSAGDICRCLDLENRLKVGFGEVAGRQAIRLVCVNPDLEEQDIAFALDEIKGAGGQRRQERA
ncbi:MAG: cysteine synthase [Acidobacteria bacterium]|nr:MAG: cysteine synthase [Acidobacteriota bacterium]